MDCSAAPKTPRPSFLVRFIFLKPKPSAKNAWLFVNRASSGSVVPTSSPSFSTPWRTQRKQSGTAVHRKRPIETTSWKHEVAEAAERTSPYLRSSAFPFFRVSAIPLLPTWLRLYTGITSLVVAPLRAQPSHLRRWLQVRCFDCGDD